LTGSGALDPLDLNPAAAVNAGRLDRSGHWISIRRDPNLGFPATEGDVEGIRATRASKRSE
jgi:hypothetical protein